MAPDHAEGLAKLAQLQKKRRRAEGQRGVREDDGIVIKRKQHSDNLTISRGDATRSSKASPRPAAIPPSLTSSATLADPSTKPPAPTVMATVRSDTPSSQGHNSRDSIRGQNEARASSDELWTSVFQRAGNDKGKGRAPMTEEQYNDIEKTTDGTCDRCPQHWC